MSAPSKEWTDADFINGIVECDRAEGFVTMRKMAEHFNVNVEVFAPAQLRLEEVGVIEGGDCHCCCIWFTDGIHARTGLPRLVDWDDPDAVTAAVTRALSKATP